MSLLNTRKIEVRKPFFVFFPFTGASEYKFDINIPFDVDSIHVSSVTVDNPSDIALITSDLVGGEILTSTPSPNTTNSGSYSKSFAFLFQYPKKINGTYTFSFKNLSSPPTAQPMSAGEIIIGLEAIKFSS